MAHFKSWEKLPQTGRVYQFWDLEPEDLEKKRGLTVVPYNYQGKPALVERIAEPGKVQGRVLLFTTALYRRDDKAWKDWNNYATNWFSIAVPYLTVRHVLGARSERQNFLLGDDVRFWLPQGPGFSSYTLAGPASTVGEVKEAQTQLLIQEARLPGNYGVTDNPGGQVWQKHFSMNLPPLETQFVAQRPSVADLETVLGEQSVHDLAEVPQLRDLARAKLGQAPQSELLPYLMIGVLLLLAGENLLANRFYRRDREPEGSSGS
jgi:hypothetical protein